MVEYYDGSNLCMLCNEDMGYCNPRQLCGKQYCYIYGLDINKAIKHNRNTVKEPVPEIIIEIETELEVNIKELEEPVKKKTKLCKINSLKEYKININLVDKSTQT